MYHVTVAGRRFAFPDLRELLAKASSEKSGDQLAGLAAGNALERAAARTALAEVPLSAFLDQPLIPPELDEVSRLIVERHDPAAFATVADLTVGQFREWLLAYETGTAELAAVSPGLTPEMVAAVSKLCRNQDLVLIASKCVVTTRFRNTIGLPGRLSTRLQPNHPSDDLRGIAASIIDGLLYAVGDATIGINPANDSVPATIELWKMLDDLIAGQAIPTQACILSHITTTMEAMRRGAPVDLVFQSVAGTQGANSGFGIDLAMLGEAQAMALHLGRGSVGHDVMYFETGQGSCLSAEAHHGIDQQTLECRAYAVARAFSPLLVNSVVGFIGPEYLYNGRQIMRAGLEDHCCGKLMGLPMGVDICYTNHAEADQDDMDNLLGLLGLAGCTFIMGIPGADDVMLGYQSTSYHDSHFVRQILGRQPAPEFAAWLAERGIARDGHLQMEAGPSLLPWHVRGTAAV